MPVRVQRTRPRVKGQRGMPEGARYVGRGTIYGNPCPSVPHRRVKAPGDIHHPGELDTYCPTAGPRRNAVMVAKAPRADRVVAFPHGASYGTRGCMRLAREAGIPVEVIR